MLHCLVTGAAGFIGAKLCQVLLHQGWRVTGLDNMNDYYSVQLKQDRLKPLLESTAFTHVNANLEDRDAISKLFKDNSFTHVVNLAAQAGVRHSISKPTEYIDSNLVGFANILEGCRHHDIKHLVFASSSSVYGLNTTMPFSVHHNVDHPISLYAATKKSNELMAHTYSYLYNLPCTGLRFFTVYGPWGRPDMALFLFTKSILESKPIKVFNHGQMRRDFTYIDDIVEGVFRVLTNPAAPNPEWKGHAPDPSSSLAPYRLYNIGNNNWVELGYFIECIEKSLGMKAEKEYLPLQPGDVPATYADVADLVRDTGFRPSTPVEQGVQKFVDWYRNYYGV